MKPTIAVSCTIIAQNEADRIGRTIQSVQGLVDEVIVVDSGSTDGTVALAESLGARVIHNPWPGFGPQKRLAEDQAKHDIILNLDADEWLSEDLRAELAAHLTQPQLAAKSFRMRIVTVYPGASKPRPFADYHDYVRLYDRRATRFAASMVHDEVPRTDDAIMLKAPVYHQSVRNFAHLVRKELSYFELQKREFKRGRLMLALRIPIEFPWQFLKIYFGRKHVFGGFYGLVHATVGAFLRWMRVLILFGW